jgi:sugar/nucleoside kinase (ribokinase family)
MEDGLYDSKKISNSVGGCAINTSRAANFYLQALMGDNQSLVKTLGSIGKDQAGDFVIKQLQEESMQFDLYQDETALTG